MRLAIPIALLAAATLAGAAHAVDVYKWKDSKGVVHYGDRPASGAAASVVTARDDRVDPDDVERAKQRLSDAQDNLGQTADEEIDEPPPVRHAPARPAATTDCPTLWHRYAAAQACYDAHRVSGGKGVTAGGSAVCKEVPQPSCSR